MTVKELINKLKEMPSDAWVAIHNEEAGMYELIEGLHLVLDAAQEEHVILDILYS